MKNLRFLLILAIGAFMFQSCNDDETAKEGDVEGKWDVTGLAFDITINGESLSSFYSDADQADSFESSIEALYGASFEGASIEFKSDGSYSSTDTDGSNDTGTWSLNSDGTLLTMDGGTPNEFSFDIITSTKNSLVIGYSESNSTQDLNQDGSNDELKISFDITMSK
ncbi:lipocalin family protein [Marivirga salinae]|uniref:Lipocalin family protein n=1 Tax=Marivirga salinarum TaxID=3059078 RepID=A0AA49GBN7_9BACT|nr:lipocalin family protein [Marivirga sp. BDSF4-3]WKK73535.2 lipocalin family protein [Marivirga sp. BDSF4-3]